jgi:hypothetical protein
MNKIAILNYSKRILFTLFLTLTFLSGYSGQTGKPELSEKHSKQRDRPVLKGPYLGQKPPGMQPEMFAPGIISSGYSECAIAFTPDARELFLWLGENRPYCVILWMKEERNRWNPLQVFPYSGKYVDMKFSVSPDGTKFLFSSYRPRGTSGEPLDNLDIWFVERTDRGWGRPARFDSNINTDWHDYYPSMASNGNLYFFSNREGGLGEDDIYFSCHKNGDYETSQNIGPPINSRINEGDPFIAPNEGYLIFCSRDREGGFGNNDLYISFRKESGTWTEPKNMGDSINTGAEEVCPFVTHDGKYFFFSSNRKKIQSYPRAPLTYKQIRQDLANPGNGAHDIYWVDATILETLATKGKHNGK